MSNLIERLTNGNLTVQGSSEEINSLLALHDEAATLLDLQHMRIEGMKMEMLDAAIEIERLREALNAAISVAHEACEEWDKAPNGMKAGKLLIALSGHLKGYRSDIDAIHAAIKQPSVKESDDE